MSIPSSISRTAIDALISKQSALTAYASAIETSLSLSSHHSSTSLTSSISYSSHVSAFLKQLSTQQKISPSRQTPLVNIGYASRILSVLSAIRDFRNSAVVGQECNLIILGGGLDPVGVWACELGLNVYEVDCYEIVMLKRKLIDDLNYTDENEAGKKKNMCVHQILDPINLNTPSQLTNLLTQTSILNFKIPTLILSELVLTYIQPTVIPKLLDEVMKLFDSPYFWGYELKCPANVDSDDGEFKIKRHLESYTDKFNEKLVRGGGFDNTQPLSSSENWQNSLSTNTDSNESKYKWLTFNSSAALAQYLSSDDVNDEWQKALRNECFDEHSSLRLYLSSYVITFGKNKVEQGSTYPATPSFAEIIVPSFKANDLKLIELTPSYAKAHTNNHINFLLSKINLLYTETYKQYSEDHTSVRKMVHNCLKKEFVSVDALVDCYFKGGFWVLTHTNGGDETSDVVAFVGLGSVPGKNTNKNKNKEIVYEVKRLCVNSSMRGRGLGRGLLGVCEKRGGELAAESNGNGSEDKIMISMNDLFITDEQKQRRIKHRENATTKNAKFTMRAATPNICVEATGLYKKSGYVEVGVMKFEGMEVVTFEKEVV